MSAEFRLPQLKNVLRVGGAAAIAITTFAGCANGESKTPTPDGVSVTVMGNHRLLKNDYSIIRLSKEGDIFLVTGRSVTERINISEGIHLMVKSGCEIIDVKRVNSGDVVKVNNPKDCLPETK